MSETLKTMSAIMVISALMVGAVVLGLGRKGPVVYAAIDGSICYVEVVQDGHLVQLPCTGEFEGAADNDAYEKVIIATQWMVDQATEEESKDLASSETAE